MIEPAIVIVAFSRAKSLERLLSSINSAVYPHKRIPLIISIDRCDSNADVLKVADDFNWQHGRKEVVYQKETLKLRKHIIQCADYSERYGAVIILEDDLYVSPFFYQYACEALTFSDGKDQIGGISLYNHRLNVNNIEPHDIMDDSYDNWYLQFASSWGQAWTKAQWGAFKTWYTVHQDDDLRGDDIPEFVTKWPNSSWLKYFVKFVIVHNKFFLYPKVSLTTNFSETGTHVIENNTDYQVPLQQMQRDYIFSDLKDSQCVYDAFFENIKLPDYLDQKDVVIDLYGIKKKADKRYLLTRRICNYRILQSFSRSMRPHEQNIISGISGKDFFLYDTQIKAKNPNRFHGQGLVRYCIKSIRKERFCNISGMMFRQTMNGLKRRLKGK
ncbi:MAG: hypothetical protein QM689_10670 [Oscillospiraceae bacterium]